MRTRNAATAISLILIALTGCDQSTSNDGITIPETTTPALEKSMTLTVDECTGTGAAGTVTNNHKAAVDLSIEVQFHSDTGELVDTGADWVTGLEPDEKTEWEARSFTDKFDSCEADIAQVDES